MDRLILESPTSRRGRAAATLSTWLKSRLFIAYIEADAMTTANNWWARDVDKIVAWHPEFLDIVSEVMEMGNEVVLNRAYEMVQGLHIRMSKQFSLGELSPERDTALKSFMSRKTTGQVDIDQLLTATIGLATDVEGKETINNDSWQAMYVEAFRKGCILLSAINIMSDLYTPAVAVTENDIRPIFRTIAGLRAEQAANYCPRVQQLLFNDITAHHFRNAEVSAAAQIAKNLDEILADPPAVLKGRIMELDQVRPEDKQQADTLKRWAVVYIRRFIGSSSFPLPGVLENENNPDMFLQLYFKIENENNDLRQFCTQALTLTNGALDYQAMGKDVGDRVADSFMPLYTVLRAAELLAGRPVEIETPRPVQPRSLSMLDTGPRRSLLSFAGRVNEDWKKAIKAIAFTNLPEEIINSIQAVVARVSVLEQARVETMAQEYYAAISRELNLPPGQQVHDRPEIFARTFGKVQLMINAWEKNQEMPDLRQLQSYFETGLIFLRYLYA
ncbi:MAG: hypothetical protein PHH60_01610 [Candidatus Margulisbacteria bacterium]|nr:hypothetical protein [Candidatus Margulisiibacteriota bacterium]